MKKNTTMQLGSIGIVLLLTCIPLIPFSNARGFSQSPGTFSFTYCYATPSLAKTMIDGVLYDEITIDTLSNAAKAGEPRLPIAPSYLLIPYGHTVETITITTGEKVTLGDGFVLLPAEEPVPILDAARISPSPDPAIYSSSDLFPSTLYTTIGTYWSCGYQILVGKLHPVTYTPLTGEISYYKDITITITTEPTLQTNTLYRGIPADQTAIKQRVDNPATIATYPITPSSLADDYDLLIITTDELKTAFEPLKHYHDAHGVRTMIRTLVTDIPVSYDENHTCDYIRDYIKQQYVDSHITYVLIGGDDDIVPDRSLYTESVAWVCYFAPTDLAYTCLDGPYNYDGDIFYGELNDGENGGDVDLMAEVAIGRACVGNITETHTFVEKTIRYMESKNSYLAKALMVGEILNEAPYTAGGDYTDELIDGSDHNGYTTVGIPTAQYAIDTLYERDGIWPTTTLLEKINNGVHLINHVGHSGISRNMKMTTDDVMTSLFNSQLCFVYSQGCDAGYFSFDDDDCFAEYMTIKTPFGAFAGVWNSLYGFYMPGSTDGPSQCYQREYWDAVFGEGLRSIGQANRDSKEDNLYRLDEDCMRWCYYVTDLFGDPSISFHNLQSIDVTSITTQPGQVIVEIENTGFYNINDIDWSVSVTGGLLGRIQSTTTGVIHTLNVGDSAEISTEKTIVGLGIVDISLTVSSPSLEPVLKTLHGFVLGPFIFLLEEP